MLLSLAKILFLVFKDYLLFHVFILVTLFCDIIETCGISFLYNLNFPGRLKLNIQNDKIGSMLGKVSFLVNVFILDKESCSLSTVFNLGRNTFTCLKFFYPRQEFLYLTMFLGQVRLGQVRLGQVRLGQVRLGQVRFGQVWLGLVRFGQVWLGLVRFGQVSLCLCFSTCLFVAHMIFLQFLITENKLIQNTQNHENNLITHLLFIVNIIGCFFLVQFGFLGRKTLWIICHVNPWSTLANPAK